LYETIFGFSWGFTENQRRYDVYTKPYLLCLWSNTETSATYKTLKHSRYGLYSSSLTLAQYAVCYWLSDMVYRFPCPYNISPELVKFLGNC